jgi:hypothetical protein
MKEIRKEIPIITVIAATILAILIHPSVSIEKIINPGKM